MRFRIFFIAFLSFFAAHTYLYAQKNIYQFSHLDISNGLSNNRVSSIFKDANGFMWFGTTSGVNRYDGYKFKVFKHEPGDPNSLIDNNVIRIEEGPDRSMWLYTHGGISVYNSNTESFSNDVLHELSRYKVPAYQLSAIRKTNDGNFWFLTANNGVYLYNSKTRTTRSYSTLANYPVLLHSDNVTDIIDGGSNKVWFIYSDGVIDELDTRTNHLLARDYSLNRMSKGRPEAYSAI